MTPESTIYFCAITSLIAFYFSQSLYHPSRTVVMWAITMALAGVTIYGFTFCTIAFVLILKLPSAVGILEALRVLSLILYASSMILLMWPLATEFFSFTMFDFDLRKQYPISDFKRYRFSVWKCFSIFSFSLGESEFVLGVKSRDGANLKMKIWRNQNVKAPAIIHIFGGGYAVGSVNQLSKMNAFFVDCGYHVIALDYRLLPKFRWPTPRLDIQDGWNFVLNNLDTLKIDPEFYVFAGRSAGAHLALDAVAKFPNSKIKGVLNLYAPVDWLSVEKYSYKGDILFSQKTLPMFFGGSFENTVEIRRDASPIHNLYKDFPPILTLHGDRDPLVPWTQSTELQEKCKPLGIPNFTLIIKLATHVFDFNLNSPTGQRAGYSIRHFLKHLKEQ